MKWMLMAMGVAAVTLAAGSILAADSATAPAPAPAPEKAAKGHGGKMAEKLGLSDDQKAQVKAILQAAHEQAKAATDPEAKKKIMHDAFDKIKTTVLTEDQRTKLAALHKERIHARCAKFAEKLGLTDDQKAAAKAIMTQARADAKNATDPAAKKAVFKAAFEKIKTTVLTDAQRDQLAKMKEQWKANHPKKAPEATPGAAN